MDVQLKRGLLEVCVLASIRKDDSYGYKIIKDLKPCIELSESTLYTILKRLENLKMLSVKSVEHDGRLRKYYHIENEGIKRLEDFLNPIKGNYNYSGWAIGEVPNTTQISNALKEIKGIHYIENIRLVAYRKGKNGNVEVDVDKISQNPYALPLNGTHDIIIKVKN